MKWLRNNIEESVPTISLHVIGRITDVAMTLTVETGETFYGAFLSTPVSTHAGLLKARVGGYPAPWMTVGTGLDSECWLGTLTVGSYEVTFRLNFPDGQPDGIAIIPVMVVHGRGVPKKCLTFRADYDKVWIDNYAGAACWGGYKSDRDSEGRPSRVEYHEAAPGVKQFDAVFIDVDDSRRINRAQTEASGKESCVIGIVTDAGVEHIYREFSAAIAIPDSGRIYEHGGQIAGSAVKTLGIFDTDNQCWLPNGADSATERYYQAIVYYSGKIYIHGGKGASGEVLDSLECLDPATGLWTTLTAGGTARYGHHCCPFDGKLLFIGGLDSGTEPVITVDIYDPGLDTWSVAEFTLSLGFAGPGEGETYPYLPALAFDPDIGYLYAYGGWSEDEERPGKDISVWDMMTGERVQEVFSSSDERWAARGIITEIDSRKAFIVCGGRCNSALDEDGGTVNDNQVLIFWLDSGIMTRAGVNFEARALPNAEIADGILFCWGGTDTEIQENMDTLNLVTREHELLTFAENPRRVVRAGTVRNRAWIWTPGDMLYLE